MFFLFFLSIVRNDTIDINFELKPFESENQYKLDENVVELLDINVTML